MFGAVAVGAPNPPERAADDGAPDLLKGGAGDDTLEGGGGADVLVTSAGRDTVSTGTGNDRVFATKGDKLTTPCSADDQVRFLGAPTSGATGELRPDGCARLPSDERVPSCGRSRPPPPTRRGRRRPP